MNKNKYNCIIKTEEELIMVAERNPEVKKAIVRLEDLSGLYLFGLWQASGKNL